MSEAVNLKPLDIELEIVSGPHLGQRFTFADKPLITIGRGPENDIVLANDPRTSRLHAEIKFSDENFYVYNRANKNYILINGIKDEQALLSSKSSITIGDSELKIIIPGRSTSTQLVSTSAATIKSEAGTPATAIQFKSPLQPLAKPNPLQVVTNNPSFPPQQMVNGAIPKPMAPPSKAKKPNKQSKKNDNLMLYLAGAIVVVGIFLLLPKKEEEKPKSNPIVTPILEEEVRLKKSEEELEKAREKMKNLDSRKMMARQFLVSGMREYNNGQYHKAIEYLASAFQSDPTLDDAAKYHLKSKQNLDKLIDYSFSEGKKYKESNNYRMCKASFQTVLFYIKNNMKHPRYIEAKQYYDECSSLDQVGRL